MSSTSGGLPVVLFIPSNDANFREMAVVADFLEKKGLARSIFIPERETSIHSLKNEFTTLNPNSLVSRTLKIIERSPIIRLFPFQKIRIRKWLLSLRLRDHYRRCLKILEKNKPVSIVLRGDRHLGEGWEPSFIKAGKKTNVQTIVLTYSFTSDPESLLYRRRGQVDLDGSQISGLENRFPGQYYFDQKTKKNILYRPIYQLEALKSLCMLPRYPWVMGGGNSDIILVAGEGMKQRLTRLGCYEDKIRVTGLAIYDELYKNYQKKDKIKLEIYERYGFSSEKQLITVSPLQLFEEKLTDLETAKRELASLMELCSRLDSNILVSLHPRMKKSLYENIIKGYSLQVADESLFDIIICSDIYAAPYSSTVEWAVLCGIPTVIFDFYNLNYTIYDHYKGVVITKDKVKFLQEMNKLLTNKEYHKKLTEHQCQKAPEISPFDGKNLERIEKVILNRF